MKTIGTILSNVFKTNILKTLPEITNKLLNQGTLSNTASKVMREGYVAKFLSNQLIREEACNDTLNLIDEFINLQSDQKDIAEACDDELRYTSILKLCTLAGMPDNPALSTVYSGTLAYFNEQPLNLACARADTNRYYLILTTRSLNDIDFSFLENATVGGFDTVLFGADIDRFTSGDDYSYSNYFVSNIDTDGDAYVKFIINDSNEIISFSRLIDSTSARLSSLCCCTDILKAAQIDDTIEVSRIRDIAALYGESSTTQAIASLTAGLGSLSCTSVVTLIARILDLEKGELDSTTLAYSPLDTPTYVDDIFSFAFTIISTAVSLIVMAISKVFGAILLLLSTIVSEIIKAVRSAQESTQAKVTRLSSCPVWNMPLGLAENSRSTGYSGAEIVDFIQNYGCALAEWAEAGSPFHIWILPKDANMNQENPVFLTQAFLNGLNPVTFSFRINRSYVAGGGYFQLWSMSGAQSEESWTWDPADEIVGYDDSKILNSAFNNLCLSMNRLAAVKSDDDTHWDVTWPQRLKLVAKELSESAYTDEQCCAIMYAIMEKRITQELVFDFDYDDLYAIITSRWYKGAMESLLSSLGLHGFHLCAGNEIAKPAIEWPTISKAAMIGGVVIGAVAVAVTITTTILVSRGIKKMATSKLALRQANFDSAVKAYQADPTAANKTAVYRANRKLTRAWNLAGRSGVSMYNGFSTSTTDVASSSSSTGGAGSVLDTIFTNFTSVDKSVSDNDQKINKVYTAIVGSM